MRQDRCAILRPHALSAKAGAMIPATTPATSVAKNPTVASFRPGTRPASRELTQEPTSMPLIIGTKKIQKSCSPLCSRSTTKIGAEAM